MCHDSRLVAPQGGANWKPEEGRPRHVGSGLPRGLGGRTAERACGHRTPRSADRRRLGARRLRRRRCGAGRIRHRLPLHGAKPQADGRLLHLHLRRARQGHRARGWLPRLGVVQPAADRAVGSVRGHGAGHVRHGLRHRRAVVDPRRDRRGPGLRPRSGRGGCGRQGARVCSWSSRRRCSSCWRRRS